MLVSRVYGAGMDDIHLSDESGTTARIAPSAGFCCLSWTVEGREYLHLPVAEETFRTLPKTGGVPLLYPYANRLRHDPWPARPEVKRDHGLPCHGFLLRFADWDDLEITSDSATAILDWAAHPELYDLFPHRHRLRIGFAVSSGRLRVTTTIEADGGEDVPISFGWHPYLALPGVGRDDMVLELPGLDRVRLDERGLPMRSATDDLLLDPRATIGGELTGRSFDDLYRIEERACAYRLTGPGVSVDLHCDAEWNFIQVYAPAEGDFACLEPMTGAVAALSDGRDHPVLRSGERFSASFELSVHTPVPGKAEAS